MGHLEFEGFDAETTKALEKKVADAMIKFDFCQACSAVTCTDIASGKPAPMTLADRLGLKVTLCTPCARLMLTQMEENEHGDNVMVWRVA